MQVGGLSYAAYKWGSSLVQEKVNNVGKEVVGVCGGLLVSWMGLGLMKRNSELYVRLPILREEWL